MDRRLLLLSGVFLALLAGGCAPKKDISFIGSGTIEATEVTVSAQARGTLALVAFAEGDTVSAGQTLAQIDVKELELQRKASAASLDELDASRLTVGQDVAAAREVVEQARITLENTQTTRDRISSLFAQGAATNDRLDQAETNLALALSRLRGAQTQLVAAQSRLNTLAASRERILASLRVLDEQIAKGAVVSPVTGAVIQKLAEQGEAVNFGSPICTIADLSTVWLMVYVGGTSIAKVKLGQDAHVYLDSYPDQKFEGSITWISPKAEFTPKNVQTAEARADLVYGVKITLPNPKGVFKIGMPADADIGGL